MTGRRKQSSASVNGKEALSRREAAAVLGISEGLVIKMVRLGRIAAIRIGKCVRIPRNEIERILREGV